MIKTVDVTALDSEWYRMKPGDLGRVYTLGRKVCISEKPPEKVFWSISSITAFIRF